MVRFRAVLRARDRAASSVQAAVSAGSLWALTESMRGITGSPWRMTTRAGRERTPLRPSGRGGGVALAGRLLRTRRASPRYAPSAISATRLVTHRCPGIGGLERDRYPRRQQGRL